jgi:hypothetical protein
MADRKTIRLEKRQIEALSDMVDDDFADNESEALRVALNIGLTKLGVLNGAATDTSLRRIARHTGFGLACIGAFVVGLTYFGAVTWRLLAVVPFLMSMTCYAIDRVLAVHEPSVSNAIGRLFGRLA